MGETEKDVQGKNADERFTEIRAHFLKCMALGGIARTELYYRPKPGDAREPTEEEIVKKWAAALTVPVNTILNGITFAFEKAWARGDVVTSFRYCVPQLSNYVTQALQGPRL